MDVIELTNFSGLNPNWTARGRIESLSLGRRWLGGHWMHYNPWANLVATAEDVRAYCATNERPIPDGHPRGFDHSAMPLGWAANPAAGGSDEDVPVGDNGIDHGDVVDADAMYVVPASAAAAYAAASGTASSGVGGADAAAGDDVDVFCRFLCDVGRCRRRQSTVAARLD